MTSLTPFDELFGRTYNSSNVPRNLGGQKNPTFHRDYFTILKNVPAYIFEYAKLPQPKFYNMINDCEFYVGEHHWNDLGKTQIRYICFTVLNGLLLLVKPRFARNGIYESYDYNLTLNPPRRSKLIEAVPKAIAMSYYFRLDSFGISEEPPHTPSRLFGDHWHTFDTIASFHNISDWERYLPLWLPEGTC